MRRIFMRPEARLSLGLKRELFAVLSADIKRQLGRRAVSEEDVLADFETWRRKRRATRRRR